jgi:hypothetical protein
VAGEAQFKRDQDGGFGCAAGLQAVWCLGAGGTVVKLDPKTTQVLDTFKVRGGGAR